VIEAIAERLDWKRELYARIAPHLAPHAILASNTSGLSINGAGGRLAGRAAAALLRHPLLQPAALHAPGRADPGRRHRCRRRSMRSKPS
jgi:3-hydroxyacyl-CoA dehydrogenase